MLELKGLTWLSEHSDDAYRKRKRVQSLLFSRFDISLNLKEPELFLFCHINQFSVLSLNDTQMLSGTARNFT